MKFDPNTNEHLVYVLKRAYRYALGDFEIGSEEIANDLMNAICNEIGDDGFQSFVSSIPDENICDKIGF